MSRTAGACIDSLCGDPVDLVAAGRDYLDYTEVARYSDVLDPAVALTAAAPSGQDILALDTQSFAGHVLGFLEAPTDSWW